MRAEALADAVDDRVLGYADDQGIALTAFCEIKSQDRPATFGVVQEPSGDDRPFLRGRSRLSAQCPRVDLCGCCDLAASLVGRDPA
jgi:hypothetical protein